MDNPRQDQSIDQRAGAARRVFTREQLEGELGKVEALQRRRSPPFASAPTVKAKEPSRPPRMGNE